MGQQEILICLQKSKKPLNIREIAEKINLGERNVQRGLKIMLKYNEVDKVEKCGIKNVYKVSGDVEWDFYVGLDFIRIDWLGGMIGITTDVFTVINGSGIGNENPWRIYNKKEGIRKRKIWRKKKDFPKRNESTK